MQKKIAGIQCLETVRTVFFHNHAGGKLPYMLKESSIWRDPCSTEPLDENVIPMRISERFTVEGVGGWPLDALWMMGSDHIFFGNHRKFSGFGYIYIVSFF